MTDPRITDLVAAHDEVELAEMYLRLQEAMTWYAERRNYMLGAGQKCEHLSHAFAACAPFHRDAFDGEGPGARARAALAEVER